MARTFEFTRCPLATRAAARRSSMREFVHDPMNTRSIANIFNPLSRLQRHILQRQFCRAPLGFLEPFDLRHASGNRRHHPGIRSPGHERTKLSRINLHELVELCICIGRQVRQYATAFSHSAPVGANRRPFT